MPSGNKLFGKRIKELREAKKLTQEQFAEKVNLEYQTISRIETGYYFTNYKNIENIARVLDVPVDELFKFSHLIDPEQLKSRIISEIKCFNLAQLQFCYKFIMNLKEFNK